MRLADRGPLRFGICTAWAYNHFAYGDAVNTAFLGALMRPPYRRTRSVLPPPRHPISAIQPDDTIHPIGVFRPWVAIAKTSDFRLPVLLRQYFNLMEARSAGSPWRGISTRSRRF